MSEGERRSRSESSAPVVIAVCLLLVLLLAGLLAFAGVGWIALRARQAEMQAVQERVRAEQAVRQAELQARAAADNARQAEEELRKARPDTAADPTVSQPQPAEAAPSVNGANSSGAER